MALSFPSIRGLFNHSESKVHDLRYVLWYFDVGGIKGELLHENINCKANLGAEGEVILFGFGWFQGRELRRTLQDLKMGQAAVFCNERSSAFYVSNTTRFGITQSCSVSLYFSQLLRVSCVVENKI